MAKKKTTDELNAEWAGMERPENGQIFRHHKGGEYEIIATGFLENSESPCVVYRSLEKDVVWVRTAENFLEQVDYEGIEQPRFKLI